MCILNQILNSGHCFCIFLILFLEISWVHRVAKIWNFKLNCGIWWKCTWLMIRLTTKVETAVVDFYPWSLEETGSMSAELMSSGVLQTQDMLGCFQLLQDFSSRWSLKQRKIWSGPRLLPSFVDMKNPPRKKYLWPPLAVSGGLPENLEQGRCRRTSQGSYTSSSQWSSSQLQTDWQM